MLDLIEKRQKILLRILVLNIFLALYLLMSMFGVRFLKSSILEYSNITSDSFDGTSYPIVYIPNWLEPKNTNKSLDFSSDVFSINDFIKLPEYNTTLLKDSSGTNNDALLARYTYPVVYMGNYKLDYEEYAGSHPAIDIRAPIGTPVLSIANGVVVKVKNTESGVGKYVVIRHDNVDVGGVKQDLFSSYEHLSEIFAEEGTKISRGDVLGKVGITGITTTPHLHFQIDKEVATYSPFWPFTFAEAQSVGLDFFGGINAGLGKETAMAYTINPMKFVKDNLSSQNTFNSAPELSEETSTQEDKEVNTSDTEDVSSQDIALATGDNNTQEDQEVNTSDTIVDTQNSINEDNNTSIIVEDMNSEADVSDSNEEVIINTEPEDTEVIISNPVEPVVEDNNIKYITNNISPTNGLIFSDIDKGSKLYKTTKYLYEKGITKGYEDGRFGPGNTLTRREALIFIFKLYGTKLDSSRSLHFADVKSDDFIVPYAKKALDLTIIAPNNEFRPNDIVTRAEFITMLIKASGRTIINSGNTGFPDIKSTDWYSKYIETFLQVISYPTDGRNFEPNNTFSRGQIANILYVISNN